MDPIPLDQLPVWYASFMAEIKIRIDATNDFIQTAVKAHPHPRGFIFIESAYLQIRQTCELLALAVLIAHNDIPEVRTKKFSEKWNADALFGMLSKLNARAFPMALRNAPQGPNPTFIADDSGNFMGRNELKRIYVALGDRLHAGTLAALMGKPRNYSIDEANGWLHRIADLLNKHIIILEPSGLRMITFFHSTPDGAPACSIWKREGESESGMRCLHTARGPAPLRQWGQ